MKDMNENQERKNPFFEPYNTPHDVAPFDRIRLEDFEEAMLEGIRRDDLLSTIRSLVLMTRRTARATMTCLVV